MSSQYSRGGADVRRCTVGVATHQLAALTEGFVQRLRLLGTPWEYLLLVKVLWREWDDWSKNIQKGFKEKVAPQFNFGG